MQYVCLKSWESLRATKALNFRCRRKRKILLHNTKNWVHQPRYLDAFIKKISGIAQKSHLFIGLRNVAKTPYLLYNLSKAVNGSLYFKDSIMKNTFKILFAFSITLLISSVSPLLAQQASKSQIDQLKNNPAFYEVDPNSVSIEYLGDTPENNLDRAIHQPVGTAPMTRGIARDTLDFLDKVINVAKKVWDIIDDSKPVANVNTSYASALPYGTSASQLSGWQSPKSYRYSFYVKNLYGIKTVDVAYKVSFQYGGGYNGQGRFLTGVTVVPEYVDTLIGYSFYMTASVPDSTVVNIGTKENPIAALRLVLQWRISTIIKDSQATAVYYITGDGRFQQLSSPFRSAEGVRGVSGKSVVEEIVPTLVMPAPNVPEVPSIPAVPSSVKPVKNAIPANSLPAKLKKNIDHVFDN